MINRKITFNDKLKNKQTNKQTMHYTKQFRTRWLVACKNGCRKREIQTKKPAVLHTSHKPIDENKRKLFAEVLISLVLEVLTLNLYF